MHRTRRPSGQTMINVVLLLAIVLLVLVAVYFFRGKKEEGAQAPAPVRSTPVPKGQPTAVPTPKPWEANAETRTGRVDTRDPSPEEIDDMKQQLLNALPTMIESAKKSLEMTTDTNQRQMMEMRIKAVERTLDNVRKVDPRRKETWQYLQQSAPQ